MRNLRIVVYSMIVLSFCFTMAAVAADFDDSVKDTTKAFTDAVSRHDAVAIAGLFDDDARVYPPNTEVLKGREAIEAFFRSMLTPTVIGVVIDSEDKEKEDDLGVETGTYELKGAENATLDKGTYVLVWKKKHGKWRIHRDIWNSSLPPAPPQP